MVQKAPAARKGMTLGKGISELLRRTGGFQQELTTLKTDLRELGDRLQTQIAEGFSQISPPAPPVPADIPKPQLAAFSWLRILNRLEDLTLDKTPKRHEAQFEQCLKAFEEACLSTLPADSQTEWHSAFMAVCLPFTTDDLTSPAGLQERQQRHQAIMQLRLKVLHQWGIPESAATVSAATVSAATATPNSPDGAAANRSPQSIADVK